MSDIINDGTVAFGSQDVTIGGVVYATDDISMDNAPGTSILRTGSTSKPTGAVDVRGVVTGSMTCQLATPTTATPAWGAQFTLTGLDGSSHTMSVLSIGKKFTKNGETKVPVTFRQNITGSVTVT